MKITELINAAAGILFSTACTGTCIILIIVILSKIFKKERLDSAIIGLMTAFTVMWVIDIILYVYLVIMS